MFANWKSHTPRDEDTTFRKRRSRSVFSLLKAVIHAVSAATNGKAISFVLNSNVLDDASMKIRGSNLNDRTSQVSTIMNNVQHMVIKYDSDNGAEPKVDPELKHFQLHQPCVILDGGKALDMAAGFVSWLMCAPTGVGQYWRRLGLPDNIFESASLFVTIFIGDSLRGNDTFFLSMCNWASHHNKTAPEATKKSMIQIRCLVHQLNLIRRPLALCFTGYWATQVRLGHLFESSSFKIKFADALVDVISESFDYVAVQVLPAELSSWRQFAIANLR
jgi:hypothetical protein